MKKYPKIQLDKLNADETFQKRIDKDEILYDLMNSPKRDNQSRVNELGLALGGVFSIDEVMVPAPTVGVIMILGVFENPILIKGKIREIDVDVALFVFIEGKKALDGVSTKNDLEMKSAGICDNLNLDRGKVFSVLAEAISISFAAYEMIPDSGEPGRKCFFDLAWFASTTSVISEGARISADEAGWSMPLAMASNYIVRVHAKNGGKTYQPYDSEAVGKRLNDLMDARIKELGL